MLGGSAGQPVVVEAVPVQGGTAQAYAVPLLGQQQQLQQQQQGQFIGGYPVYAQAGPGVYTYSSGQYVAQPVQQPVAPVYVVQGAPQTNVIGRDDKYTFVYDQQRQFDNHLYQREMDQRLRYEQARRQQDQEEACCCFALGALCCAAFLVGN
mmetsp:Transcript_4002/g.10093  ORF Transcript_4002/g.10093 Transcript_4002/m.10093 type:complete len:152 (-) Transcript_4002:766-1221(-)